MMCGFQITQQEDRMNYEELIQQRQSIRSFRDKAVSAEQMAEIKDYFNNCERLIPDIRVSLELCTGDAGTRLEGVVGYRGNAFFAPLYLVLLSEEKEGFYENMGYMAEALSLKLTDMGLDACWLTVDHGDMVKKTLLLETALSPVAVIACGYGKPERGVLRIDIMTPADVKFEAREGHIAPKIAQSEMVYDGSWGVTPSWEEDQFDPVLDKALYAATLAPSFLNRQTYRYLLKDRRVILCEKPEEMVSEADRKLGLGATMYNFHVIYTQYNHSGHGWKVGSVEDAGELRLAEGYEAVASMQLW